MNGAMLTVKCETVQQICVAVVRLSLVAELVSNRGKEINEMTAQ